MGAVDLPILQYTSLEEIPERVARVRRSFLERKTRDIEFRLTQLRRFYWVLKDHEEEIAEALRRDLGKPRFEAFSGEILWLENEIVYITRNLYKWAEDEKAPDIPFAFKFMSPKIRKDPLGTVLVIGAFNVPFQLTLVPVLAAIAAGNTVVIKPSENAGYSAALIQKLVETALDPSCYTVIQGSIPEMQVLLAEKWDKIFFTGSSHVGRIVAKAAAAHMTPVVLELGGMNPAIVTKNADPKLVSRRMLWGKTLNAGQICTSQNYMLVEKEILPAVLEEFKKAYAEFFPQGSKSAEYGRIVSDASFHRIKSIIQSSKGEIILGGTMDERERYIEPTIIQIDSLDDPLLAQETFGPIITIFAVDSLDEAIRIANKLSDTSLSIYPFGNKEEVEKVISHTRSGGVSINDASVHIPTLVFGGVGDSGQGAYRGKAGFDTFVHHRAITQSPSWLEPFLNTRYPPFTGKTERFRMMSALIPDFDRNGRKTCSGWLRAILTLGAGSSRGRFGGAVVLAVGAYIAMLMIERRSRQ